MIQVFLSSPFVSVCLFTQRKQQRQNMCDRTDHIGSLLSPISHWAEQYGCTFKYLFLHLFILISQQESCLLQRKTRQNIQPREIWAKTTVPLQKKIQTCIFSFSNISKLAFLYRWHTQFGGVQHVGANWIVQGKRRFSPLELGYLCRFKMQICCLYRFLKQPAEQEVSRAFAPSHCFSFHVNWCFRKYINTHNIR